MAFDPIEIDLQDLIERAASRPLVQFRQAEVFNCLLAALNSQTQELQEAAESVILDENAAYPSSSKRVTSTLSP